MQSCGPGDAQTLSDDVEEIKCETSLSSDPPLGPETPKQITEAMKLTRMMQAMSESTRVRPAPLMTD